MDGAEHPTKTRLRETAVRLLSVHPRDELSTELLLAESQASPSSLYHHFHSFSDLLDEAELTRFSRSIDAAVMLTRARLARAKNPSQFLRLLWELISALQDERGEYRRIEPSVALSRSTLHRAAERIAQEQQRFTDEICQALEWGKEQGWLRPDLDTHVAAALLRSYVTIWAEGSMAAVGRTRWVATIQRQIRALLLPD